MSSSEYPRSNPDALEPLARIAVILAGSALLGLVLVQGWQVFARYVMNDSPSWTEPVTIVLLSTAMSFGAACGVHAGSHFNFTLLLHSVSPRRARLLQSVSHLIVVFIGAGLGYWSTLLFLDGLDLTMAGAPLPQGTAFAPLALGGMLMALFGLQKLWQQYQAQDGAR